MTLLSRLIILFSLLILGGTSPAFAGPFGLSMGMSLEDLEAATGKAPVLATRNYFIIAPPKQHPVFKTVAVRLATKTGLFSIKAIGAVEETSSYGDQIQKQFSSILSSIETVYGRAKVNDTLKSGSIWNEPRDWMMSLYKKERQLAAIWRKADGLQLPDNIVTIFLYTIATSSSEANLVLEYTFSNFDEGSKELEKVESGAF